MKINFLNEYYKNKSSDQNSSDIINMYLEQDTANGKYPVSAYPTPGLTAWGTPYAAAKIISAIEHRGVVYTCDSLANFNSVDSSGNSTNLGIMSGVSNFQMAQMNNQIMIVNGAGGWNWNSDNNTFTNVSSLLPAPTPNTVGAQDGFFLIGYANQAAVYACSNGDGLSWNPLAFGSTSTGEYITGIISNKRYLYILTQRNTEVWFNSGASPFPFQLVGPGASFSVGCYAPQTLTKTGATYVKENGTESSSTSLDSESLIFLSQSKNGGL